MRKDRPAKLLLEFSIIGFSLASWHLIVPNWNFSMLPYWRGNNSLRNMGRGMFAQQDWKRSPGQFHWSLHEFCDEIKGYEFGEHVDFKMSHKTSIKLLN